MINQNNYEIIGDDLQVVKIYIDEGKSVLADPGNLVYMSDNIEMSTTLGGNSTVQKLINGIKRQFAGENFFLTSFQSKSGQGEVAFSAPTIGKIIPVELSEGGIICEKRAYLCSDSDINISVTLTKKFGAGLFGKEGFILQKLTGRGTVFLQSSGTIIKKTLAPNEQIRLDPGCITAFDPSVDYDIKYVGSIKTALFGGVGLFFATLTGPGNVLIQSLPFNKLSNEIVSTAKVMRAKPQR